MPIGTSQIYCTVEDTSGVADSLIVHLEDPDGGTGRLVMFVATPDGRELDDDLQHRLWSALRAALSPQRVPDEIHRPASIPTTQSGKKSELPVKTILLGSSARNVASPDSLRNLRSVDEVVSVARGRQVELPR